MNEIFSFCVKLLNFLAEITGLSYQAVNVWIFCIILPAVLILMVVRIMVLNNRVEYYRTKCNAAVAYASMVEQEASATNRTNEHEL